MSVLVAGATGQLGRVIAEKLIAAGTPTRVLARNAEKLASLGTAGAEVAAVDLLNLQALTSACRGVTDIVATANNNMGKGATSPLRVDLTAYQNLCAAARNTGVKRIVYVSFRGATPDVDVDIFRVKWHIEDVIRRSQVPYVILRPSAFMDVWLGAIMVPSIKSKGVTPIFGDGTRVGNYVSVEDVAELAVRVLARPEIRNEVIDFGGPSDKSFNEIATLVEKKLGAPGKRRHVPVAVMKLLPPIVRPFNEVVARMMTLGRYAATQSTPFPQWKVTADRFGVTPETIEHYVERMS